MIKLINGNCLDELQKLDLSKVIIVSDPPFNIGYKYKTYKDKMKEEDYYNMLNSVFKGHRAVVIHYPECLYHLAITMQETPIKVVSWVYNSNTAKQHRDIAFFNVKPDFNKVKQPYKNPNDKRIKERIKNGKLGCKLYDWWNVNQVKNVSKDKTAHPCQMPLEVMQNIIGVLPEDYIILDPFMGSGTTGLACKILNRDFIGIELDEIYFKIAKERIESTNIQLDLFGEIK